MLVKAIKDQINEPAFSFPCQSYSIDPLNLLLHFSYIILCSVAGFARVRVGGECGWVHMQELCTLWPLTSAVKMSS